MSDLALAVRNLIARPGLSAATGLTLALGVGANAAIFSLVDAVLLRPPAVHDPDGLVSLQSVALDEETPRGAPRLSYLELEDFARDQSPFDGVAGYTAAPVSLTGGEGPAERVWGATVTGNFFDVLGVRLSPGPGFSADERNPATARPVAVISHALWHRRFGASLEAVGRRIEIGGVRYTVVGVAPEDFRGLELEIRGWLGSGAVPAIWTPVSRAVPLPFEAFDTFLSPSTRAATRFNGSEASRSVGPNDLLSRRAARTRRWTRLGSRLHGLPDWRRWIRARLVR